MNDTNYISSIVKIIENSKETIINDNISVTRFRVQIPQVRNNTIVNITLWGNLGKDIANYYQVNDYILIEGYLSVRNKKKENFGIKNSKKVEITVLKVYPFLLNPNHNSS